MLEATSKYQTKNGPAKPYKKRKGIQGNSTKLNGIPCAWCGKLKDLDLDTRYDCENEHEFFTFHQNCYKEVVSGYPATDILNVLYQAQLRKDKANGIV